MLTKRAKRELLDKLHRGFVRTMIGVTSVGFVLLCFNTYEFVNNRKRKEKMLLSELEGKDDPEEFPVRSRRLQGVIH